jgi:hypothetical protein
LQPWALCYAKAFIRAAKTSQTAGTLGDIKTRHYIRFNFMKFNVAINNMEEQYASRDEEPETISEVRKRAGKSSASALVFTIA